MSELSVETLQLLQETAAKAAGAEDKLKIVTVPGEPGYVYYTVGPDGHAELREAKPSPRKHVLQTVDQVGPFATRMGENAVVWFDRAGIVVIDDENRRDRADLKLEFTPIIKTLIELEKNGRRFPQRDFVRLLRIDFDGARTDDRLLAWARDVKFRSNVQGGGKIGQGRESLGRDIDEAVEGADGSDCPEEITLRVRVFDDPTMGLEATWPVRCAVEVDASQCTFQISPYPLELHLAIESEVGAIGAKLRDELGDSDIPVFRGRP